MDTKQKRCVVIKVYRRVKELTNLPSSGYLSNEYYPVWTFSADSNAELRKGLSLLQKSYSGKPEYIELYVTDGNIIVPKFLGFPEGSFEAATGYLDPTLARKSFRS